MQVSRPLRTRDKEFDEQLVGQPQKILYGIKYGYHRKILDSKYNAEIFGVQLIEGMAQFD